MQEELSEMIIYLFNELNKVVEFKVLLPTQNLTQSSIRETDFDHLGNCITDTLKPKLGDKFNIGADGIWTFWDKNEVGVQKRIPKILAAYFFIIKGIEKIEDIKIKDSRSKFGVKTFSQDYWDKYVRWYKQSIIDERLAFEEYISVEEEIVDIETNLPKERIEYRLINDKYWKELNKRKVDDSEMFSYYLETNSSERLLPNIIAKGDYVQKETISITSDNSTEGAIADIKLKELFNVDLLPQSLLLKVLGEGGEGKSTFLLHVAKMFCSNFNILYFKINHAIDRLVDLLPDFDNEMPVMILIDDVRNHRERLEDYSESLRTKYYNTKYVLIVSERKDRYKTNKYFEDNFDRSYTTIYKLSISEFEELFDKFWIGLKKVYPTEIGNISEIDKAKLKRKFIGMSTTVCDRIEQLFKTLGINHTLKSRFDEWDDWDNNINSHPQFQNIRNLYTITALFYKFGIPVPVKYFEPLTQTLIIDAIAGKDKISSAIILDDENFLKLRHETKADKYLTHSVNRKKVGAYFDTFLDNVNGKEAAKLFRNLYVHPEFKSIPFLTHYLSNERCEFILRKYLIGCDDVEERGKTTIHLCRTLLYGQEINLRNKKVKEVIELLENLIIDDRKNLQARATLSSLLIKLNPTRSYELLNEILQIDQNNVEALVNLIVLYSTIEKENTKFEDLLVKLKKKPKFTRQSLLQVARRFFGVEKIVYAVFLLEYYVSNYSEHEGDYLLERGYKKINDLDSYEVKFKLLKNIGNLLGKLYRRKLMGNEKNDILRIKLVELFMQIEEWKLAKSELHYVKDKQHTNFKLIGARIWAHQGNYHSAYQILNSLVKKEPENKSVLVPLIKVCKNYLKFVEGRGYALKFLSIEPADMEVMNLYLDILFDEVGTQRNKFLNVETRIFKTRGLNEKQNNALQFILSGFYYKWSIKTTVKRNYGSAIDINASRHFSKEKMKLAIKSLPDKDVYSSVKSQYLEALNEIDNEVL